MISLFSNIFIFTFGIGYRNIYSFHESIKLWYPASDYKTKVRGKHQNSLLWAWLVSKIKVGKPTFVSWLFLVTLVIYGTVPIHSSECSFQEHKVLAGWAFDIVFDITIFELFARLGAYTQTQVRDWMCWFAKKTSDVLVSV